MELFPKGNKLILILQADENFNNVDGILLDASKVLESYCSGHPHMQVMNIKYNMYGRR